MTRLVDIFHSKAQVKLLQLLLDNKEKIFNQATIANFLDISPSTVARVIEPLIKLKIIRFDRFSRGMKLICLNLEEPLTRQIIAFYDEIKRYNISV